MQIDYPKHFYSYFNEISDVSNEPQPEGVPKIPFDVLLSRDLCANVGIHNWPRYSELQIFGKIESLDTVHCTVYQKVTEFS